MTDPSTDIAVFLLEPVTDAGKLAFGRSCTLHDLLMLSLETARREGFGLRVKVTMPKERESIVTSHTVTIPTRMEKELDVIRAVAQRWRDRAKATPKMSKIQQLTLLACVEQLEKAIVRIDEGEVPVEAPPDDEECPF